MACCDPILHDIMFDIPLDILYTNKQTNNKYVRSISIACCDPILHAIVFDIRLDILQTIKQTNKQ